MSLSPNQIRRAEFESRRRGYDREQVHEFLEAVAASLEATRNEAMTIESRFRAAAARVRELTSAADERNAPDSAALGDTSQDTIPADAGMPNAGPESLASARTDVEQSVQDARRRAHDEYQSERQIVLGQIAELERRRDALEQLIAQGSEELRIAQDRLRAVAESLRTPADHRVDLTSGIDPAARLEVDSSSGGHGLVGGFQPTDEPVGDERLEAPPVAVGDVLVPDSEVPVDIPVDIPVDVPVDEPGSNPR